MRMLMVGGTDNKHCEIRAYLADLGIQECSICQYMYCKCTFTKGKITRHRTCTHVRANQPTAVSLVMALDVQELKTAYYHVMI